MNGYIYEITTDLNTVELMRKEDFYDRSDFEANEFSEPEDEKSAVKEYLEAWKNYGAETGTEENGDGEKIHWIIFNQQACENFFKDRFKKMKEAAAKITLREFSTDDVWRLKNLISDDHGDAVYCNTCFYAEDDFVRTVKMGKKHYLGYVLYMD